MQCQPPFEVSAYILRCRSISLINPSVRLQPQTSSEYHLAPARLHESESSGRRMATRRRDRRDMVGVGDLIRLSIWALARRGN